MECTDFGRLECHHPQLGKDGCLWEERTGYVRPYIGWGRIEAYPMFDDGEEDDNVLRLIGLFLC